VGHFAVGVGALALGLKHALGLVAARLEGGLTGGLAVAHPDARVITSVVALLLGDNLGLGHGSGAVEKCTKQAGGLEFGVDAGARYAHSRGLRNGLGSDNTGAHHAAHGAGDGLSVFWCNLTDGAIVTGDKLGFGPIRSLTVHPGKGASLLGQVNTVVLGVFVLRSSGLSGWHDGL